MVKQVHKIHGYLELLMMVHLFQLIKLKKLHQKQIW